MKYFTRHLILIILNVVLFGSSIELPIGLTDNEKYKITPLICKYITIFNDIHEDEIELVLFTNTIIEVLKQ